MADNKRVFTVEGKEYAVTKPSAKQNEEASMEYNRVFSRALKNGALLRESLEKHMREQNLWDDEKQELYGQLLNDINEKEKTLSKGGIKLSEAREMALEMKSVRAALQSLISERNSLDINTAQGQAENSRFNYLLSSSLVYNETGEQVFDGLQEYLDASTEGNKVAFSGAENFANMYYGLDKDYEKNLPENRFLRSYKFVDDELRLINKEGSLVDFEGRLIDEEGRYIDEKGNLVNFDGEPVTNTGEYNFETAPFLDEDGNPLGEKSEKEDKKEDSKAEAKEEKKPRGRPKKTTAKASSTKDE